MTQNNIAIGEEFIERRFNVPALNCHKPPRYTAYLHFTTHRTFSHQSSCRITPSEYQGF